MIHVESDTVILYAHFNTNILIIHCYWQFAKSQRGLDLAFEDFGNRIQACGQAISTLGNFQFQL